MKYKYTCNSCGESIIIDTKKALKESPIKCCVHCGFKYVKEELVNKDEVIKKLEEKKSKLEDKYYKVSEDENNKVSSLGWGCAMKGYKKLSSLNLTRSDKIDDQIDDINKQLKILRSHEDGMIKQCI